MNAFVVSGLVKRRAELAGEIPAGGNAWRNGIAHVPRVDHLHRTLCPLGG
jgi:hypothetical protein